MFKSSLRALLLAGSVVDVAFGAVAANVAARDGTTPSLTFDPKTTSYCTWWVDLTTDTSCDALLSENLIDLDTFRRWNPSITAGCGNLLTGHSYCVEALSEPITTTSTTTTKATPTTSPPVTTTKPGNGVETPTPTQDGMVGNCARFHFVAKDQTCTTIAAMYSITLAQFVQWNPAAKSDCTGLWSQTYACVGLIGSPTSPPVSTTTTKGNGITTPTPTQPDMVNNCDSFYFVVSGDTCTTIASKSGITLAQFNQWNPSVGTNCQGLWLKAYVCISIIGHTPTPTGPGNGVSTPTPIQDGMTKNCKTFYFVKKGDTCATIAAAYKISVSSFVSWNPAAGKDCTGLWTNTYACVAVL
ncbi:hypothetical protein GGS26DRAFT_564572 [Hypomontagnella submonticulosa]|nr:hypothetical protein GGS26DRAFT_564572 [Hypomontagnella submonticulosa]